MDEKKNNSQWNIHESSLLKKNLILVSRDCFFFSISDSQCGSN